MYSVRILDRQRRLQALLPGVTWRYTRLVNEAGTLDVHIPRAIIETHITPDHVLYGYLHPAQPLGVEVPSQRPIPDRLAYAEIAAFIQIYKGTKLVISGKITGRSFGDVVTVTAKTEEILLEKNITPPNYGAVWEGWDLADVARDLLDGWQGLRVKDPSQWADRHVELMNVDLTTEPGKVMLKKQSNGQYLGYGFITLRFNSNEIEGFKAWDRFRWSADSDGMANPDKVVWTTIQVSTNNTDWSPEFDGGLPEEVGYYVGGTSNRIYVRINLYTLDTESPAPDDPDEKPIGQTPVVYACEMIARTHGELVAGTIPAVAGETVSGISASHTTALKVLFDACDQVGWEFVVWDGALNLAESLGIDRTKEFVFRTATNIEIENLSDGDDELVNILTAYGPGDGINRMAVTLTDEQSISTYGPYPNRELVEFNVKTYDELLQKAQEYLEEHSQPKPEFAIQVVCDYDREPEYGLGDRVRVADPNTGIISTTRIVEEEREFGDNGLSVRLKLGRPSFSLTEVIGRDGKDGKDGKDGRPGRDGKDGKDGKDGEDFVPPIPADPVWGSYTLTSALHLTWHKAQHATDYEIRDDLNWGAANGMIFRGYSHSWSFVPRDRELILYLRALNVAGEYSEGYDTIHVSLPAPQAPDQPTVEAFFTALKIKPTPLNNPAILGYNIYVTINEQTDKISVLAGGEISYPAESGTTAIIQVSAYDIIGEGAKSEPLEATTTVLDDIVIPDWVKDPIENIEEKIVLDVDEDGNISGIVSVKDGSISNHISILADRFSIATPEGRKQVFAFDTEEHKAYILGDLISEGLIRTPEVQTDVAKALLLQAELAVVDEADILRLRADKITVGGTSSFLFSKPVDSTLWHFDNSLVSNSGIKPLDGAVATLRPGEGVFGGAAAVEEGTTNLIPSNRLRFEGWSTHGGSQVKVEQGHSIPNVTKDKGTKITSTGGNSTVKYYTGVGAGEAGTPFRASVWVYNLSGEVLVVASNAGTECQVNPGEVKKCIIGSNSVSGVSQRQIRFETVDAQGELNLIAYQPQIEEKPFATSFTPDTRPDGILAYPISLADDHTIACYRKSHTDEDYRHIVKRSDGKVFVDGVEDDTYDVGWIDYDGGTLVLSNQTGLIDELMVIPYLATEEEAQSWSSMRVPFYDPLTHIDAGTIPISAGEVEITGKGIKLIENDIVKAALGDLEGLPWGGSLLPAGEHGLYAIDAYLTGALQVQHEGQPILVVDKDERGGNISFYDGDGDNTLKIGSDLFYKYQDIYYERRTNIVMGDESAEGYKPLEIYIHKYVGPNTYGTIPVIRLLNKRYSNLMDWTEITDGRIQVAHGYYSESDGTSSIDSITIDPGVLYVETGSGKNANIGPSWASFAMPVNFYDSVSGINIPVITGSYTGDGSSSRRNIIPSGLGRRKIIQLILHREERDGVRVMLYLGQKGYEISYGDGVICEILSDGSGFWIEREYPFNSLNAKYYYTAFVI